MFFFIIIYLKDTNACANSPCLNGGTCSNSGISYACNCQTGYSGTNCQICK